MNTINPYDIDFEREFYTRDSDVLDELPNISFSYSDDDERKLQIIYPFIDGTCNVMISGFVLSKTPEYVSGVFLPPSEDQPYICKYSTSMRSDLVFFYARTNSNNPIDDKFLIIHMTPYNIYVHVLYCRERTMLDYIKKFCINGYQLCYLDGINMEILISRIHPGLVTDLLKYGLLFGMMLGRNNNGQLLSHGEFYIEQINMNRRSQTITVTVDYDIRDILEFNMYAGRTIIFVDSYLGKIQEIECKPEYIEEFKTRFSYTIPYGIDAWILQMRIGVTGKYGKEYKLIHIKDNLAEYITIPMQFNLSDILDMLNKSWYVKMVHKYPR